MKLPKMPPKAKKPKMPGFPASKAKAPGAGMPTGAPARSMPARSNAGGAVRGQARAAQVKAMNAIKNPDKGTSAKAREGGGQKPPQAKAREGNPFKPDIYKTRGKKNY